MTEKPLTAAEFTVDPAADAGYVTLRDAPVARTEQFSPSVLVDLDAEGDPVGIEILTLTAEVDVAGIAARFGLSAETRQQLAAALTSADYTAMAADYEAEPPRADERIGAPYLAPSAGSSASPAFGLQLPARLNAALAAHAAAEGITVADVLRAAVGEYFARRGIAP